MRKGLPALSDLWSKWLQYVIVIRNFQVFISRLEFKFSKLY